MNLRRKSRTGITCTDILLARNEEEAEVILRSYVKDNPTDIAAYIRLGDILRRRNLLDEAIKIHKSLLKPRMNAEIKIRVLQSLVEDLFRAKKYKEIIQYLEELVSLDPRAISYVKMLSSIYERADMWVEAIAISRRIRDSENLACLYASYGEFLTGKDMKREAIHNFNKALKLDPSCVPALLYMGDVRYKEGDVDGAIELWQQIIKNSPDLAFITFDRLESAYFEKKSFHDMVDIYENCIQTSGSIEAHRRLAGLYDKLGDREKAIEILTKATEQSKDILNVYQLMQTYKKDGDYKKAIEVIEDLFKECFDEALYQCSKCRSEFDRFHFRCEKCFEWLTLREKTR